ncbi:sigma-70 family RNA polymerase sigma factor [Nocardioides baekrokdamisoli]|uniref:sigma-70 family RNA polymerase sigma factor n=1 Tax=Nocardioides baekrokdamisoli TaxID=1804624 RepID=UPI0013DDDE52|nr:sigma-70 family RNA polymerase sigma factor [Nocardioides baekrokdamisoli]
MRSEGERIAEQELLAAARAGDDEAFAALYRQHYESALTYALTLTNPVRAHDLVSEATVKVYRLTRAGKGPETAFRAYLCATIQSVNVDSLRRVGREVPFDDVSLVAEHAAPDAAETVVECDAISRAFRGLPDRWQTVLWATVVQGRTPHDVGQQYGLSANSVSVLAMRAREGLKQAYLSQHFDAVPSGSECHAHVADLPRYVRGRLAASRHAVVGDHVRRCDECARVVEGLDHINNRFAALLIPVLLLGVPSTTGNHLPGTAAPGTHSALAAVRGRVADLVERLRVAAPLAGPSSTVIANTVVVIATVAVAGAVGVADLHDAAHTARTVAVDARHTGGLDSHSSSFGPDRPGATVTARPSDASVSGQPMPTPAALPSPASSRSAPLALPTPVLPHVPAVPVVPVSSPTASASPSGTKSLEYTNIGTCRMQGAGVKCVDSTGNSAADIVMTPSGGGTCSASGPTADCVGPLQITSRYPDPSTGQPTVLYTQTGSADSCHVRQQVLTCYRAS